MLEIMPFMYNSDAYNGSESKCGVTVDNIRYILKRQKKDWHNVISEHIASSLINVLGGNAHRTKLAIEQGTLVVLCEDFTQYCGSLVTMDALSTSSVDTDMHNHDYYFSDVCYCLHKTHAMSGDAVLRFLEMYVFDTIFGNPDRHRSNWGIYDLAGAKSLSPIYDNGASLFPRAKYSDINRDWLRERVYVWPNSKIMFEERKRSSYYEVWKQRKIPDYAYDYGTSIDITKAISWVYKQEWLSDEAKWFYSVIIYNRYNVIVRGKELNESYS